MHQHRLLNGALLIVGAELMFAFMGASIRLVSTALNNGMLVFARNLVGLLLILSLIRTTANYTHGSRICTFCAVRLASEPCTAFSMPSHICRWPMPCCSS